mgnify:CR=1 FL=1
MQGVVFSLSNVLIQSSINSFGSTAMAGNTASMNIENFIYISMNTFQQTAMSFTSQNYGAGNKERIRRGTKESFAISTVFSLVISALVFAFAAPLMQIFVSSAETAVIASGVRYLRIEGAFYFGIGCLFLLYGYYRAIKRAEMSVVLTVISLGIRVLLAYVLSATFLGETGIWMAIPIGWILADLTGLLYMRKTW